MQFEYVEVALEEWSGILLWGEHGWKPDTKWTDFAHLWFRGTWTCLCLPICSDTVVLQTNKQNICNFPFCFICHINTPLSVVTFCLRELRNPIMTKLPQPAAQTRSHLPGSGHKFITHTQTPNFPIIRSVLPYQTLSYLRYLPVRCGSRGPWGDAGARQP